MGKLGPRDSTPTKLQIGFQLLTKDFLEILDGQHQPGGSQLEFSSPELTQGSPDQSTQKLKLGPWRGEGALHLARVCSSSSWLPELLRPGKAQNAGPTESVFCGMPRNLNLSGLGLGSPGSTGPAPWRAAWSLSSVDGESTHTCLSRGKPSVAGTQQVLPTQASDTCLQHPSFPTARLNKRT